MNRFPFSPEELIEVTRVVDKAVAIQEEHGVLNVDAHPLLVRAIATIDQLQSSVLKSEETNEDV
jgi:hypothetical protein